RWPRNASWAPPSSTCCATATWPRRLGNSPASLPPGAMARGAPPPGPAVRDVSRDRAVVAFQPRVGGGVGFAVGYARWSIRRLTGLELQAPISGQRALRREVLDAVVPFAPRFGMEIGMTVDAARAGFPVRELPLELTHRATGRTLAGFWHRARQLGDFLLATATRLRRRTRR